MFGHIVAFVDFFWKGLITWIGYLTLSAKDSVLTSGHEAAVFSVDLGEVLHVATGEAPHEILSDRLYLAL